MPPRCGHHNPWFVPPTPIEPYSFPVVITDYVFDEKAYYKALALLMLPDIAKELIDKLFGFLME